MKKNILLLLCLSFALMGCGKDSIVGTWNGVSDDSLAMEVSITFESSSSGDCTYKNSYFDTKGTCTFEDDKVTMDMEGWSAPKVYKYTLEDGKLSLSATDSYSPSYKDLVKE